MTDLSKVRIVGVSIQACYLLSWLSDNAGGSQARLDEGNRWVIEVKPQHAPALAEFANLRPGKGKPTHVRTVSRWLAELVEAGIVEVIRTRRGNGYLIILPETAVDARLVRQAAKAKAAADRQMARTPSADGTTAMVTWQGGHGDMARTPSRCHDRLDRQNTPSNTTPIPAAHSIQEPGVPPDADGGGGGGVCDPGQTIRKAMIDLYNAETWPQAKAAVGRLAGQAMTEAEHADAVASIRQAIDRINRALTGHTPESSSVERMMSRWMSEFGIGVNDPQAAVDALRRVGVNERMVESLTRAKPPQVIVEAVKAVEHKSGIRNRAGAVVAILNGTGKSHERLAEAAVA